MTRLQVLQCVGRAEILRGTRMRVTYQSRAPRKCAVTVTGAFEALGNRTLDLVPSDHGEFCRVRMDGLTIADVPAASLFLSRIERVEVFS